MQRMRLLQPPVRQKVKKYAKKHCNFVKNSMLKVLRQSRLDYQVLLFVMSRIVKSYYTVLKKSLCVQISANYTFSWLTEGIF